MTIKLLTYFIFYSSLLGAEPNDSIRLITNYYKQAIEVSKTNKDKALSITQMGIDLANKTQFQEGIGDGYDLKATLLITLGDFELATTNYKAALKTRKQLKDNCKIGDTFKNLSYLYNQKGEQGQALIYVDSAILVLKAGCTQSQFLGRNYIQKGNIFLELGYLDDAKSFFLQGQKILKNIDLEGYIIATENLGIVYYEQTEFENARDIFLDNYNLYQESEDTSSLAQISNSLGAVFFELGDFSQSEAYLKKGIAFSKKVKNNLYLIDAFLNLRYLAIELGDSARAEAIKLEIEQVIEGTGGIEEKLHLARQSVDFYDMVGLYKEKAQFQEKVIMLKDSLNILEQNKLFAKELAKLDIAEKEADIQTQRFYIACLALGVMTLTFFLFLLRDKSKQQKVKHQTQIRERLRKEEEETRKKVLEASFQAKQEIHKKLHDQVSNPLSVAANYIEAVIEDPAQIEDLETANQIVNLTYDTSRKIAHELLPFKIDWVDRINLSLGGLERAKNIESVIQFNRKNINNKTFSPKKGAKVAAIIGNLLVNVEKHAEAQQVVVNIHNADDQVVIKVEDDGIGFDTNQPTGIGLLSIKSNIDALQGTFILDSIIGKGTKVTIFIPVK